MAEKAETRSRGQIVKEFVIQNQKTYLPSLSPKYSVIWCRSMDTKYTTG